MAGLKYLAGICLVIAYAWACDRSGDSLGRLHPRLHPTRAQTRVRVGLVALVEWLGSLSATLKSVGITSNKAL